MKKNHMPSRMKRVFKETPFWLQSVNTPGLSVALLENGKTQDMLCFGTTKPNGDTPITESTIFPAASLSKQALLYAALKTVETGALELDRPLAEYLDKPFDIDDPDIGLITT